MVLHLPHPFRPAIRCLSLLVGTVSLVLPSFPWWLIAMCCGKEKDIAVGMGLLANCSVLLGVLHVTGQLEAVETWEFFAVGYCIGTLSLQLYYSGVGHDKEKFAKAVLRLFGVEVTYVGNNVMFWLVPLCAIVTGYAAYFVADWVLVPSPGLTCSAATGEMCNPPGVLDLTGHCCHIADVSFSATKFVSSLGGSAVVVYGIVQLIANVTLASYEGCAELELLETSGELLARGSSAAFDLVDEEAKLMHPRSKIPAKNREDSEPYASL
eukprot:TRINITY_DN43231_c0_g1_i1.p1 TRINITY_DN43231_c0_g1~~TRINITY_DN43231_c0_g1_i1.p1  ORF type:complete len:293 (+),score=28.94 TRINITY_DN43231_c0_g1_i1:81-881(+)